MARGQCKPTRAAAGKAGALGATARLDREGIRVARKRTQPHSLPRVFGYSWLDILAL